jgi:hypothetical protein
MVFVVKFLYTTAHGLVEPHTWYKRVSSGREGIALRDRLVSLGTRADDRVLVTECKFFPLTDKVAA